MATGTRQIAQSVLIMRLRLDNPPATLFFAPDGAERKPLRVIGYLEADAFLGHVNKVLHP